MRNDELLITVFAGTRLRMGSWTAYRSGGETTFQCGNLWTTLLAIPTCLDLGSLRSYLKPFVMGFH